MEFRHSTCFRFGIFQLPSQSWSWEQKGRPPKKRSHIHKIMPFEPRSMHQGTHTQTQWTSNESRLSGEIPHHWDQNEGCWIWKGDGIRWDDSPSSCPWNSSRMGQNLKHGLTRTENHRPQRDGQYHGQYYINRPNLTWNLFIWANYNISPTWIVRP